MSNFAFLDNENFRRHPSCNYLYQHACSAEESYYQHTACAIEVRYILEQFCIFVSEIKGAEYPEKVTMLGQYWDDENYGEFLKTFGYENVRHIKRANYISCSYLHSTIPARENIYPEMLERVYKLLLWLYKQLGFRTSVKYSDYSTQKIHSSGAASAAGPLPDIYHSSEELLKHLKDFFPNCNTEQLCSVTKLEDRYVITDISGRHAEELIQAVKYQDSEEEKLLLKEQLEKTGKEFEAVKKNFLEQQSSQKAHIQELESQIAAMEQQNRISSQQQSREILELQAQLQQQNEKRNAMAEGYKKSLEELGNRYEMLQEQYEELVPLKEKKRQMQQQIRDLLEEREEQEKAFADTHEKMLGEIAGMKQRLTDARQTVFSMGVSARENQELIQYLVNGLAEKEKELEAAKSLAKKKLEALQAETLQIIQRYKNKAGSLEIILTNVMAENARFRENAINYRHLEETKSYLQLLNHGIIGIEQGYALYQQNKNEQLLRDYLWKVKNYYDSRIENLEKALREKEEKLEQERQRNNALFEELWAEKTEAQEDEGMPGSDMNMSSRQKENASAPETENVGSVFRSKNSNRARRKRRRRWRAVFSVSCLVLLTLLFVAYRDRLSGRISDIIRKSGNMSEGSSSDGIQEGMSITSQGSAENGGSTVAMLPDGTEVPREPDMADGTEAPGELDMADGTEAPGEPDMPDGTEVPGEPDMPDGTEAPREPDMPDGTEAPGETNMPEKPEASREADVPEGTNASGESHMSEETGESGNGENRPGTSAGPSEQDKDSEQRRADQVLDAALKERERRDALPKLVEEIDGVSQDLLDDMEMMRGAFEDFIQIAINSQDTEDYRLLARCEMFRGDQSIYQIDSLKAGKFAYGKRTSVYAAAYSFAVEPDAICADISYDTTLAELELILGDEWYEPYTCYPGKPTPFSEDITDENYRVIEFIYPKKWHFNQYIIFVYNEDLTEILDYVYVQEDVANII